MSSEVVSSTLTQDDSLTRKKSTTNSNNGGENHGSRSSSSSNGTTSIIRKKLNFTDEALWKQFSSRRLQLVESLSLSSKKASEQDEEIKVCANTLMTEFHFAESSLPEFDKLVRLAIQSVRRNKKRSEKRLASKLETFTSDDEQFPHSIKRPKAERHGSGAGSRSDERSDENDDGAHNLNLLSTILIEEENHNRLHSHSSDYNGENDGIPNTDSEITTSNSIVTNPKKTSSVMDFSLINHNHHKSGDHKDTENIDSRVAIDSLVAPIIQDSDKLPSIKKLDESPEFANESQKILHKIKNSKSCFEFSKNSGNDYSRTQNYDLLEEFGSSCINAAVLYTLEKWFDHLLPDSSSYIKLRLKSDLTLGLIIKNLDTESVEVNRLSNYVASQLFKKLIGGCVKDYGFDSTLNPLCDIFHSIILKDYPIIAKDQLRKNQDLDVNRNYAKNVHSSKEVNFRESNTTEPKTNYFKNLSVIDSTISQPSAHSVDLFTTSPVNSSANSKTHDSDSALIEHKMNFLSHSEMPDFPLSTAHIPIPPANIPYLQDHQMMDSQMKSSTIAPPPLLRSKQYTNVTIKFKEKDLKFRYCMDSNAPPTVLELITNCKQAFGVVTSTRVLNLRNLRSGDIIKTDHELERVLRMAAMLSTDGNGEVGLELVFANVTQGYLNLNYDSSTKSKNKNEREHPAGGDDDRKLPAEHEHEHHLNSISTGDSLIGRYLPPPRPIRPDSQPRNTFMKFQPLL
ncbi:hypothetical protein PICMEDRAFT_15543 [Pichia membranifaciens NRRL Y-2026]|uniref:Uncharacterized protein n=1 Tax=Pichia membranifaciens NRRL Y-2026 TaxID=763406 RepID=A0A1E3NNC8_9ASCO|nr:hypothetical protein PICMEDRAFT_15543 [Pichia membranifaciens NRRL Y-2026]ODQ47609.1 hypothetical protein PICMEDRAFT_15543 [Pichia membranifaciens NRRL Y-2026]